MKNAKHDELLPRGGSALLNELDGNLTLWKVEEGLTELHTLGKFRGAPFDPLSFEMELVKPTELVDARGRQLAITIVKPVGDLRKIELVRKAELDEALALAAIRDNPRISVEALGQVIGKSKTSGKRMRDELLTLKWIKKRARQLQLTSEGQEVLDEAER